MFNLTLLTTCSLIFYMYGNSGDIPSQVTCALMILNTFVVFLLFILFPGRFRRFRFIFKHSVITFFHYIFHIILILLNVILLGTCPTAPWAPLIPQFLLFCYTLIRKPYNYIKENIRSCFNLFTMMGVTSMKVYVFYVDEDTYYTTIFFPLICLGLLFIVVIWGFISTLIIIVKTCRG